MSSSHNSLNSLDLGNIPSAKNLKFGIASNPNDSSIEKQISYAIAL